MEDSKRVLFTQLRITIKPPRMTTNIVVLDCQKMFVEGLDAYFKLTSKKYNIISRSCSAKDFQRTIENERFEILITELNIPDQDGMEVIERLRLEMPEIKILVLSSYTDFKLVKGAMLKGADGYVSKSSTLSELIYGLEEIQQGNTYIGDGLRTSPAAFSKRKDCSDISNTYEDTFTLKQKLTKREHEILELITQGKNNKNIGSELYISDQTVGVHRKNIMKKLGIRNTASLIKFALENHLV